MRSGGSGHEERRSSPRRSGFDSGSSLGSPGRAAPGAKYLPTGPPAPGRREVNRESPAAVCMRQHGTAAAPDPSPRLRFVVISERGQRILY